MCHAIVWYHVLCRHQDQSQTSTIPCFHATATGYDCLPHYQPILDLPLSGECHSCRGERKWQQKQAQMQRIHADSTPAIADVDDIAEFDVDEIDVEKGLEQSRQTADDGYMHLWVGGADLLATEPQVVTNSDLGGGLGHSWYDKEYEGEVDLDGIERLQSSSPRSEMEFGRDACESSADGDDFPKSPVLGYAGSWDLMSQQSQSTMPKSKIPVPVSQNKLLDRVWKANELELFDQLTF